MVPFFMRTTQGFELLTLSGVFPVKVGAYCWDSHLPNITLTVPSFNSQRLRTHSFHFYALISTGEKVPCTYSKVRYT